MSLICPSCSHVSADDSRYCQRCGTRLSLSDRSTKYEPEDGYRSGNDQSGYSKSGYYGEYGYGASDAGGRFETRSSPSGMLVWSILATVFCCQPAGIVAIVFTALAMSADGQGNYALSNQHLGTAKTWAWVAFGLGLVGIIIYVVIGVVSAMG